MTTQYNVSDLTDGNINGNGVFDVLMRSMAAHLQKELDAGRINGTDFSDVYTALASNTMTQSIQFLLSKDSSAAQADLVREQVATQLNTTALEAERVNTQTNQTSLLAAQELKVEKETEILNERGGFR